MVYSFDANPLKRKFQEDLDLEQATVLAQIESARETWADRRKQAALQRQIILRTIMNINHASEDKAIRRVSVKFNEEVAVMQIPNHSDYELETRKNIWGTPAETKRSILRNKLEFAFEGFDFDKVLEEGEFVPNYLSRSFVHPVHKIRKDRKFFESLSSSTKLPRRLVS